ncbi:MAG: nucleoside-diphosphate sugar epimerase/dehydratase, partial [Cyanobacteria bacterium P01_H01_bin.121]
MIHQLFHVYKQVWRLFSLRDTITLLQSTSTYSLLSLVITRIILPRFAIEPGIPFSVAFIDWTLCLGGMITIRYLRRRQSVLRKMRFYGPTQAHKTLIIGAGNAGAQVLRETLQNPNLGLAIVGFLDDDPTKVGRQVEGVPILGHSHELPQLAASLKIRRVLIAMASASAERVKDIVASVEGSDIRLQILPTTAELLDHRSLTTQVRDVQIQDLLGRPEIKLEFSEQLNPDFPSSQQQIAGKVVLVTGAGGTIGAEICRQLVQLQPQTLILLGRGENSIFTIEQELKRTFPEQQIVPVIADIRNHARMQTVLQAWQPQVLFHAAAHKHVPLMQSNPTEAIENNALASLQLAKLAEHHQVQSFVMISTDKAVEPTSFMGMSKRLAELLITTVAKESQTRFLVVRFGNVLGSRGSVVPIFQHQIQMGGPVTVTDAATTRYFMTPPEAAQLVIQSLAVGYSGQLLLLDMGQPVRIYDLAEQLVRLAGYVPHRDIKIQVTGLR